MNIEKAISFIHQHGNPIEQARLRFILDQTQPAAEIITGLFAGQQSNGAWAPFWASDYASIDATCFRLAQADQLGLSPSHPALRRARQFLAVRQSPDSSWEEEPQVAGLAPPWAMPGDLAARLYLTANCGLWLSLADPSDPQAAGAASYLRQYLTPEGSLPGFLHTGWLGAGLWQRLSQVDTAGLALAYLATRLTSLVPSSLAWLATTLLAAGLPASHPVLTGAAALLAGSQLEDGRFPSADGPSQDVHVTLEALRALLLCLPPAHHHPGESNEML